MALEFHLLGTVAAYVDGTPVDLGHARQQCVLATLLLRANHRISSDQLVDQVWGANRPYRGRDVLYSYLSRLRRALAHMGEVSIERQAGSYVLTVDEMAVDLHRFRRLVSEARATEDDGRAIALFGQALELWRGDAFAGLDAPLLNVVRDDLDAERLAVELDHTDLRLRLGRHDDELVTALTARAARYPLNERLSGQLILALYRGGRQADALNHYHMLRSRLADEQGVDPTPRLQRLYRQILDADQSLGGSAHGTPRRPVPQQLPAAPPLFSGRADELAALTEALDEQADLGNTVVISAIGGTGGIGKTCLALHWAHQHLDRFPDGQLHVNLRGYAPSGEPMPPAVAVRSFLDALGVNPVAVPVDLDAQIGLYRSLVANRRMLVLLDNAADTAQVTPLLPGSLTCTVLVTSRRHLTGLVTTHGARSLDLDVLADVEARELLAQHLGRRRLAAEPDAVTELVNYCAGLPLALSITAARAAIHPSFPLAALAEELRNHVARLDVLDAGDAGLNLRTVFSWSYRALDTVAANLFGLLSLAPGPDVGLPAAASLIALPVSRVSALLWDLEAVHLVAQPSPGRYRMHDLVRLYAAEQARRDQPVEVRDAALRRLVDFYLHSAYAGDRLLEPNRPPIDIAPAVTGCCLNPLEDEAAMLAWFDAEHSCLLATQQLAAEQGWHAAAWQLAWALDNFHWRRGHLHDALAVWRVGVAAAEQLDDPTAHSIAHQLLGGACTRIGENADALKHLQHALTLAEQTGDVANQAEAHQGLAWAWAGNQDDYQALVHVTHALRLCQALDNPVRVADTLNVAGWFHARVGQHQQARDHCERALAVFRHHHDREGQANVLDSLGYIAHHSGEHSQALDYYQEALYLCHELSHTYGAADILDHLGETYAALGRLEEARDTWRQAIDLYQAQHRSAETDRVRQHLAVLDSM